MRIFKSAQERIICLMLDQITNECLVYKIITPGEAADRLMSMLEHMLKLGAYGENG